MDHKRQVNMPNEIFADLHNTSLNDSSHIAFAYSYYYLITYLYRYAMYGEKLYTQEDIKEMLGYSRSNKTLNYIIKKDGILDQIGYTETVKEFPIEWHWDEFSKAPEFTMYDVLKSYDELQINSRNYKIKYPIKAFYRHLEDVEDDYKSGTYFEPENTHIIDYEVFKKAMNNKDIGVIGFYLYGYLKHKNDMFKNGYNVPFDKLIEQTKISRETLNKYLKNLYCYHYIEVDRKNFHLNRQDNRLANKYKINAADKINGEKREVNTRSVYYYKAIDTTTSNSEKTYQEQESKKVNYNEWLHKIKEKRNKK